jgi:hypothetical protein
MPARRLRRGTACPPLAEYTNERLTESIFMNNGKELMSCRQDLCPFFAS